MVRVLRVTKLEMLAPKVQEVYAYAVQEQSGTQQSIDLRRMFFKCSQTMRVSRVLVH
ncbi:GH14610 [Drosophila grimshawi]|uniref:GH14610 n=1 Tax=Drosophila grimshawi TaxID=7222 RepID=B4IY46_DROGR|nr:GH14610 [Drosophila grimshawi]